MQAPLETCRMESNMSVNGITSGVSGYSTTIETKKAPAKKETPAAKPEDTGVIYEPSKETATDSVKKIYKPDTATVEKMLAEAEERTAQLRSLVEKILLGQGEKIGTADEMWGFLRKGDFEVDEATRAQAQADIAEDGYWGVEKTSDRIVDFAKALTGGDPSKIGEMRDAFLQAFDMAKEQWGGELPEISQKTYDAVLAKFDAWEKEATGGEVAVEA